MTAPSTPSTPATPASASGAPTVGVFSALYRLVLRTQARRGRLLTLGAIALLGVLLAVATASANEPDVQLAAEYVDAVGLGFILPIMAGIGIGLAIGEDILPAALTGLALAATSIGITSRVLAEMGVLDRAFSRVILGAAIVDDILALLAIGVLSSLAEGELGLDTIPMAFSTGDEDYHAPNEFFRVASFDRGLKAWARVFPALARL